jgi:flagellar hook-associated protein 1 FlgK
MSINGALQVGRTAMVASQAAMQVAGNNMANAATEGYHRRVVYLTPSHDEMVTQGAFVGTGVLIQDIKRQVDTALESRFRDAVSQEQADLIDQRFLTALETIQNELTDADLSSALSDFFNAWSELANNPEDPAVRSLVIEQGGALSRMIGNLRSDYNDVMDEVDRALGTVVTEANDLLDRIAELNVKISQTEGGGLTEAGGLRDQRDLLLNELSQYLEIDVIQQASGSVDVLVDSVPVVLAGVSRGIELRQESVGNQIEITIRVAADGTDLSVTKGQIGGLLSQRENTVQPAIDALNEFTAALIYEVNRLHSQGQGQVGFTSITGTYGVNDTTTSLNSPTTGLEFPNIVNGSFFVHVTHQATGIRSTYEVSVDGNADSLDDLINEINVVVAVPNVTAGTGINNTLTLTAAAGFEMSFSDDTSGVLATLGINTFFDGSSASDIGLNQTLAGNATLLAAGQGHVPGSNGTALAIVDVQSTPIASLNNQSLREKWQDSVNSLAVQASSANRSVEASRLVRDSLAAQIQAVSGVSLDEESINLLMFQRQFQAAARFISVIDETLQTLLSIG